MHRNAPLTPEGRLRLCQMIEEGWTIASSAESMRISRQTAHKWWRRYLEAGPAGLEDRSSRPRRCPTKTSPKVERRLVELRRRHQLGPARLAPRAGVPASTLHRVLQRHGVSRLSDLERKSGRTVRRIETSRPGELVHMDVKKQARIPKGGGWRVKPEGQRGRLKNGAAGRPRLGYACIHSAIDAHSRLAYSEVHRDEKATTAIAFWRRAKAFFESYGITVERVLTDNGSCYVARIFDQELVANAIKHSRTKPFHPQTNGKVERYNRTLLNEWAYARPYRSEAARTRALDTWLHMYNHHRHHTAIDGPPVSRVNNLVGQNT
jgi:transposase InsO family protein